MSENEPGRPDRDEDTAPLWSREHSERATYDEPQPSEEPRAGSGHDPQEPAVEQPQPQEGWAASGHHAPQPDPYAYDPYGYAGYPPPTQQLPYQGWYPPPQQDRPKVPGWMWPVVAATALVLGLFGGAVSALLVSSSLEEGATSSFEEEAAAPAPLDPENGSIAAVAEALLPSTVQILTQGGSGPGGQATGSGFVVDRRGHVITNNHVVAGVADEGEIEVLDHAGRSHTATIVGRSPVYDIAVLDVEGAERLQPAALGSSRSMNVGETVVAIGSPLGLGSTVTSGIVSAVDRPVTTGEEQESSFINAVQTDAAINPGNSGGPLVNLRGEVVGVNSAIATMGSFAGEGGNIGVGFAIPMEQVKVTASQIVRTGEAEYPIIGAEVDERSQENGAKIVNVNPSSPADAAGLEDGDIVVAVDGQPVTDGIGLIVAIRSHKPGDTITLTLRRDDRARDVEITLDAKVG